MQRLDSVFGVGGWRDRYEVVNGINVICTLSVKVDGEWIDKTDVGAPSEHAAETDKLKSPFTDALKRAACKLGIARYLYRLPRQWVDYEPQKKQFVKTPTLPAATPEGPCPGRNGQRLSPYTRGSPATTVDAGEVRPVSITGAVLRRRLAAKPSQVGVTLLPSADCGNMDASDSRCSSKRNARQAKGEQLQQDTALERVRHPVCSRTRLPRHGFSSVHFPFWVSIALSKSLLRTFFNT